MRYRVLVLTLACGILSGCASSRPSGAGADAAEDGATGGDGATVDSAEPDGASPDGAGPDALVSVDANIIDATVIDGAVTPIDAAVPVDAAVPIDANGCATQPCSLAPQCGCTAPLTCDIDFTDLMGTACRAVNVPGTETSTCTTFSECAAGYVCAGGHCLKYCANDASCPQPRGLCAIQITDGMGAAIPGAVTCSSNCDPTNSAGGACPTGQKCGFFTTTRGGADLDILECTAPGAGGIGAACVDDSTCSANTLCTTVSAQSRCRRVCNRSAGGNECATVPGTTCIGFGTPLTIGGTEYGVCAP
jgi:hypothetical protein